MSPTVVLYETQPFLQQVTAPVVACRPAGDLWQVALEQTVFYPEGGGQPCDVGTLGGAAVSAVTRDADGVVWHTVDAPLPVGAVVEGHIDAARRRDHMEQHTGEHILSGTLHRLFGAENVGFHIGSPAVRMDLDRPLTAAQLAEAEAAANAVIRADAPVRAWVPDPDALTSLPYRSKKALEGPVRLVDAGGADLCACCGTHLERTGQVGLIKILSAQHYKGGMRLAVVCGARAWQAVSDGWADAAAAGVLLSAPVGGLTEAVTHRAEAEAALKQRLTALQTALSDALCAAAMPGQAVVRQVDGLTPDGLRRTAMALTERTGAFCGLFTPTETGFSYVLCGAPEQDVREVCKALNAQFAGRGGGKPGLCQGSIAATDWEAVRAFLERQG